MSIKNQLKTALAIQQKEVMLAGLESPLIVRSLGGQAYMEWGDYCREPNPDGTEKTQQQKDASLIVRCVFDEQGRVFNDEDIPWLVDEAAGGPMLRLQLEVMEVNGMLADEVKKPSSTTPSDDSATAGR